MEITESVKLAVSALMGGLVGAAATVGLQGHQVAGSIEGFRNAFRAYIEGKNDPASQALHVAFEELDRAWVMFGSALDRLIKAVPREK